MAHPFGSRCLNTGPHRLARVTETFPHGRRSATTRVRRGPGILSRPSGGRGRGREAIRLVGRADELLDEGDLDGQTMWRQKSAAIEELLRKEPGEGEGVH